MALRRADLPPPHGPRFSADGSLRMLASLKSASDGIRIVVVDDDDPFRESLALNLTDEGYAVTSFSTGSAALAYFASGGEADVILLDWRMPGMNGLAVMRRLRRAGNATPVIFLTVLGEDTYEEAALEGGAVDYIVKSRRLPILVQRLRLIAKGARPAASSNRDVLELDRLELRLDIGRASWAGTPIDLTLSEFKVVALLALRTGEDVSYREIYDLFHGGKSVASKGDESYRANVRTLIKRIRKKLHAVDPEWQPILNYAGFGYRWQVTAD